eukprot:327362_1
MDSESYSSYKDLNNNYLEFSGSHNDHDLSTHPSNSSQSELTAQEYDNYSAAVEYTPDLNTSNHPEAPPLPPEDDRSKAAEYTSDLPQEDVYDEYDERVDESDIGRQHAENVNKFGEITYVGEVQEHPEDTYTVEYTCRQPCLVMTILCFLLISVATFLLHRFVLEPVYGINVLDHIKQLITAEDVPKIESPALPSGNVLPVDVTDPASCPWDEIAGIKCQIVIGTGYAAFLLLSAAVFLPRYFSQKWKRLKALRGLAFLSLGMSCARFYVFTTGQMHEHRILGHVCSMVHKLASSQFMFTVFEKSSQIVEANVSPCSTFLRFGMNIYIIVYSSSAIVWSALSEEQSEWQLIFTNVCGALFWTSMSVASVYVTWKTFFTARRNISKLRQWDRDMEPFRKLKQSIVQLLLFVSLSAPQCVGGIAFNAVLETPNIFHDIDPTCFGQLSSILTNCLQCAILLYHDSDPDKNPLFIDSTSSPAMASPQPSISDLHLKRLHRLTTRHPGP